MRGVPPGPGRDPHRRETGPAPRRRGEPAESGLPGEVHPRPARDEARHDLPERASDRLSLRVKPGGRRARGHRRRSRPVPPVDPPLPLRPGSARRRGRRPRREAVPRPRLRGVPLPARCPRPRDAGGEIGPARRTRRQIQPPQLGRLPPPAARQPPGAAHARSTSAGPRAGMHRPLPPPRHCRAWATPLHDVSRPGLGRHRP